MKKTLTKYFIRVRFKCKPAEFWTFHSDKAEGDFLRMIWEQMDTEDQRKKGFFILSIQPLEEQQHCHMSLIEALFERLSENAN